MPNSDKRIIYMQDIGVAAIIFPADNCGLTV